MIRVTARLRSPVVAKNDVHLDGLLVWSASQEEGRPPLDRRTKLSDLSEVHGVPVPKVTFDGYTVYLSSAWMLPPSFNKLRHYLVKRRDAVDVESLTRVFNPGYGPGRDRYRQLTSLAVDRVSWLACTDDPRRVQHLLRRVTYIGALGAHGCGEVGEWVVEEIEGPPEHVLVDEQGISLRVLPVSWCSSIGGPTARLACSPPYWHPDRHIEAVPVGAPVVLRQGVLEGL